jgi:hypothetical protein
MAVMLGLGAAVLLGAGRGRSIGVMSGALDDSHPVARASRSGVGLIVVMLSGPVLHHRKVIGELSPRLFVDQSQSKVTIRR